MSICAMLTFNVTPHFILIYVIIIAHQSFRGQSFVKDFKTMKAEFIILKNIAKKLEKMLTINFFINIIALIKPTEGIKCRGVIEMNCDMNGKHKSFRYASLFARLIIIKDSGM